MNAPRNVILLVMLSCILPPLGLPILTGYLLVITNRKVEAGGSLVERRAVRERLATYDREYEAGAR